MKVLKIKVKDDGTLKNHSWAPKAFYDQYDLKDSKRFELLKGAPLCYRVNGLFIEESWLYNHMINFFYKIRYDTRKCPVEWIIL